MIFSTENFPYRFAIRFFPVDHNLSVDDDLIDACTELLRFLECGMIDDGIRIKYDNIRSEAFPDDSAILQSDNACWLGCESSDHLF